MSVWFHQRYRDPVECCPYESAEGGYQFIYGGPYDPREELEEEFDGIVRREVIEELAEELSSQADEWTGPDAGPDPDLDEYFLESLRRSRGHREEFEASVKDIETLLDVRIDGDPQQCLMRLLYANVVTALEAYLCDFFIATATKHPEVRRRFVETHPEFKEEKMSLSEVFQVWDEIDAKVEQCLVDLTWHNLRRVIPMFKSSLGVVFPKDLETLFKAILVRHDLVHRNGKKKDGGEHRIGAEDVRTLIASANSLVNEIEKQWEKLKPDEKRAEDKAEIVF